MIQLSEKQLWNTSKKSFLKKPNNTNLFQQKNSLRKMYTSLLLNTLYHRVPQRLKQNKANVKSFVLKLYAQTLIPYPYIKPWLQVHDTPFATLIVVPLNSLLWIPKSVTTKTILENTCIPFPLAHQPNLPSKFALLHLTTPFFPLHSPIP